MNLICAAKLCIKFDGIDKICFKECQKSFIVTYELEMNDFCYYLPWARFFCSFW